MPAFKNLRFKPRVIAIAKAEETVRKTQQSREIVKAVVRGESYEDIAEKHGIEVSEAAKLARETINRWSTELGATANEAKALDLRRMEELLLKLHPLVFPPRTIDGTNGEEIIIRPDLAAVKLMLDIMKQRAAIYGYEAAVKLEEQKQEILQRIYSGVKTNAKGEIDI